LLINGDSLVVEHHEWPQIEQIGNVRELLIMPDVLLIFFSHRREIDHPRKLQHIVLAAILLLQVEGQLLEVDNERDYFLRS